MFFPALKLIKSAGFTFSYFNFGFEALIQLHKPSPKETKPESAFDSTFLVSTAQANNSPFDCTVISVMACTFSNFTSMEM